MKSVIPSDEEILYSSLGRGAVATSTKYITNWETHILITNQGIAFGMYQKKGKFFEKVYVPLYDIVVPGLAGALRIPEYCHLYLKRHTDYETKQNYRAREKAFEATVAPLVIEAKKNRIITLQSMGDKASQKKIKKLSKEIPKIEKVYQKWSKWLK